MDIHTLMNELHPVANFFKMNRGSKSNVPGALISPSAGPRKFYEKCNNCGSKVERSQWEGATGTATGKLARRWPDNGAAYHLVFSQRVLDALHQINATGFIAHTLPVEVTPNTDERGAWLLANDSPAYYWMEITGQVNIDRNIFDGRDGELCPVCFDWTPRKGGKVSWGGSAALAVDGVVGWF